MKIIKNLLQELRRYVYYRKVKKNITFDEAINVLNEKDFFLITSTGRTATTLFANLFNKIDDFYVVHEALGKYELRYHRLSLEDKHFSRKFIGQFRLQEIAYRALKVGCSRVGEVNPGLRRNIEDIKYFLPSTKIIHIIRDPRDFITSALNRDTFLKGNEYYSMIPSEDIIEAEKWSKMDRFEKICNYWAFENKYMRLHSEVTVQFELLTTDYEYFKSNLLDILNSEIDYDTWYKAVSFKVNANQMATAETLYENWTEEQKKIFLETCAPEMENSGYEID